MVPTGMIVMYICSSPPPSVVTYIAKGVQEKLHSFHCSRYLDPCLLSTLRIPRSANGQVATKIFHSSDNLWSGTDPGITFTTMGANNKPFIAFFGATGGSCLAALTRTLQAGYPCAACKYRPQRSETFSSSPWQAASFNAGLNDAPRIICHPVVKARSTLTKSEAVARSPPKLHIMLSDKGVPDSTVSSLLTIVQGDIHNTDAVSRVLTHNNTMASIIVCGIGAPPTFSTLLRPVTICTDATKSIFTALRELEPAAKPLYVGVSTTGITMGPRDVPWLLVPIYRLLGHQPHADKRNAENVVLDEMSKGHKSAIENYVIVRPSLLTYGPALGRAQTRAGIEKEPAVGYTISRDDVGGWIFENLIDDEERRREWAGAAASITY